MFTISVEYLSHDSLLVIGSFYFFIFLHGLENNVIFLFPFHGKNVEGSIDL